MLFNLFKKTLTVSRPVVGNYINNIYVDGNNTEFTIKASVQPAGGDVLEMLPEGYRTKETYVLYTDTMLNTATSDDLRLPDIVKLNLTGVQEDFIVIKVDNWSNTFLKHFKVIVQKKDIDAA